MGHGVVLTLSVRVGTNEAKSSGYCFEHCAFHYLYYFYFFTSHFFQLGIVAHFLLLSMVLSLGINIRTQTKYLFSAMKDLF